MAEFSLRDLRPEQVSLVNEAHWVLANQLLAGGVVSNSSSAHTAASHLFRVTIAVSTNGCRIDGLRGTNAVATNLVLSESSEADYPDWNTTNRHVTALIVAKRSGTTFEWDYLFGEPAPTDLSLRPTTAAMDAQVGHKLWIPTADVLFSWTNATGLSVTITAHTIGVGPGPAL